MMTLMSLSLTLMHVPPATNRTAVVIRERCVFVWETDGSDERCFLHTLPILFLQFDQNWHTDTQCYETGNETMKSVV